MTHICVNKITIMGSDNGLSPGRRQAIIWTNAGILLIRPLGTIFNEMLIEILTFSFMKMRLKVSSAKWRQFCLGLNVLNTNMGIMTGIGRDEWLHTIIVCYVITFPCPNVNFDFANHLSSIGSGTNRVVHLRGTNYILPIFLFRCYRTGICDTFLTVKYSIQWMAYLLRHGSLITGHYFMWYYYLSMLLSQWQFRLYTNKIPGITWQFILECPSFKRFAEIWLNASVPE